MKRDEAPMLAPPPWLQTAKANQPLMEQLDVAALFAANLTKMHHHQSVAQWIRTWAFAIVGFSIGSAIAVRNSLVLLTSLFIGVELILFIILLKDVEWHKAFWRYRDRARACEGYLLGNLSKQEMRDAYFRDAEPSRIQLLRDAFSFRKLITVSTDFMESYFIIGLAFAFAGRLILMLHQQYDKAEIYGYSFNSF